MFFCVNVELFVLTDLVEHGLTGSACYIPSKLLSPTVKVNENAGINGDFVDISCNDKIHDVSPTERVNKRTINGKLTWSVLEDSASNIDLISSTQLTFIECQSGTVCTSLDSDIIVQCETDEVSDSHATLIESEILGIHCGTPTKLDAEHDPTDIHCGTPSKSVLISTNCNASLSNVFSASGDSDDAVHRTLNDNERSHNSSTLFTNTTPKGISLISNHA